MNFPQFGLKNGQSFFDNSSEHLGGKGAGLIWMSENGVPVPPGFVIPTSVWAKYDKAPKTTMKEIAKALPEYLGALNNHFGYVPLLAVRSGARVSCPGMMDTILNVGLDDGTSLFWIEKLDSHCYRNSYHRLITMYGSVVEGIDRESLEKGNYQDARKVYEDKVNKPFPNAFDQLLGAIEAVFKSWDNDRAMVYRKKNNIPREWGTAVVIQAMVFGNLNDNSGTGVLFTRNADTGSREITGEFLINAQGEDVVAGIRTPMPLMAMFDWNKEVHDQLIHTVLVLEAKKKDVQDVEFTIQDGQLYILQTRNAKRTPQAAVRIAVDMVNEKLITPQEALKRISAKDLDLATMAVIDPGFKKEPNFKGLAACSGVVKGKPVFSSQDALNCKEPCILITQETTPDDLAGMLASVGVITMEGGFTSHAAVVARGDNKPCITGVGVQLSEFYGQSVIGMDGSTGNIWLEDIPILSGESNAQVEEFKSLIINGLGFTPVITDVPSKPLKEAVLYLGAKVLNIPQASLLVSKTATQVDKLYLDLTITETAEREFLNIFEEINPVQVFINVLEQGMSVNPNLADLLKNKLIVIGSVETGFQKIHTADDLNSLILAKDEVLVNASLNTGDKALEWVLKHKAAEGLKFIQIGTLNTDSKSILSVEQVLATHGKGV